MRSAHAAYLDEGAEPMRDRGSVNAFWRPLSVSSPATTSGIGLELLITD